MISAPAAYLDKLASRSYTPIYRVGLEVDTTPIPDLSPTAYWKLDEVSGGRADSRGSNNLDNTELVPSTEGKIGLCAEFIAAAEDFLLITDNVALSMGDVHVSFAVWVMLYSKSAAMTVFAKGSWEGAFADSEYRLHYSSAADRMIFSVSVDGTATTTVQSDNFGTMQVGIWYYVACWHDKDQNLIGISINDGSPNTTAHSGGINDGAIQFLVGGNFDGGTFAVEKHWDGRIDELGVWKNYVFRPEDITHYYNNGYGLPIDGVGSNPDFVSSRHPRSREPIGAEILMPHLLTRSVQPEEARFPLTTLTFDLLDHDGRATAMVAAGIVGGACLLDFGFFDLDWADHIRVFTGIVTEITAEPGRYRVTARSPLAAAQDKIVFNGASTRLTAAINSTDTTLAVVDATSFERAATAPDSDVRAVMVENEIMSYRVTSSTSLDLVQRPGANGYAVPPYAGPHGGASASHAIGVEVHEMPKLGTLTATNGNYGSDDLHPIELLKSVFTIYGKSGIAEAAIRTNDTLLDTVKALLGADVQMRFLFKDGLNAKKFIEEELFRGCASYPIENALGELGIKLLQAGSAATIVDTITDADIIGRPRWLRNAQRILTTVVIHYDWMPITNEFQSAFTYRDDDLVEEFGRELILDIECRGIHSYFQNAAMTLEWFGETADFLLARSQAWVSRFGGISPVLAVTARWKKHLLECGDDIEATFSEVPNLPAANRSLVNARMEVIASRIDFNQSVVELELLAYPS